MYMPSRSRKDMVVARLSKAIGYAKNLPCCARVEFPDGSSFKIGEGEPTCFVLVRNARGLSALTSLDQLNILEAYFQGHIEFTGDLISLMSLQDFFADNHLLLKVWRRLKPRLLGRTACNPAWIQKHYDSNNLQLICTDSRYHAYTPGIYFQDDDSMEESTVRKYEAALRGLNIARGADILDVGCGWGGFLRFCSEQGHRVEGVTLSKHQHDHVRQMVENKMIAGSVRYQDFFTHNPGKQYDAISAMGVIEDLSDYPRVMKQMSRLIKPGGRIYFDFAATDSPDPTSSFITKYVWPGTFRMVYMPEFIKAVVDSPFEFIEIVNDRRNYHLWAKKVYEAWNAKKDEILRKSREELWRVWNILFAGTASVMDRKKHGTTAYRVILEMPKDYDSSW